MEDTGEIRACISGKAIPAGEINDETFFSGVMGEGIGTIPSDHV